MQIYCFSPFGYEGSLVSVEVDLRRGIPAVDLVGLADGAVKESRERMRSAIINSGYDFPSERVLISLSPADVKKEGAGFDLAIALAVLAEKFKADSEENFAVLVMGELELNGKVRPVKGIQAAASTAIAAGISVCIVPSVNACEAREIRGMKVYGAESLCDAFEALWNREAFTSGTRYETKGKEQGLPENAVCVEGVYFQEILPSTEFSSVKGQEQLVRGLQIAAAGNHNLLAYGPPGCGKTMAIQKLPGLQPLLTMDESQSVTRIYSLAGLLAPGKSLVRTPPFRMPHQTASIEGICGGGVHLSPGEISLSHKGVLFLDEAAEFRSSVLQMLRVPLESKSITLSRAGRSTVFPADFQLIMATNPCPCGNYGSKDKICLCSAHSVEQYWKKFSAPLLDRIEIRVGVDNVNSAESSAGKISPSTQQLRQDIARAVKIQRKRQGKHNASLTPSEVAQYCVCEEESREILEKASERYGFSPRAVSGCMKLARTISDMKGNDKIDYESMKEAVDFRKKDVWEI